MVLLQVLHTLTLTLVSTASDSTANDLHTRFLHLLQKHCASQGIDSSVPCSVFACLGSTASTARAAYTCNLLQHPQIDQMP
jgi:hypothetical protein